MNRRSVLVAGAGAGAAIAGGLGPLAAAECAPPAVSFTPRLFELRSYLAQPGRRDELIGMFEDVFLDAYQAGGAKIVGTFRSLDEPDRWVWMRAFPDAPGRGPALAKFYGGAVWKANADACNATIADIDAALLLRAARAGGIGALCAPPRGSSLPDCVYVVDVLPLAKFTADAAALAVLVTDDSENSYPRQPVRADRVAVTITRYASAHDVPAAPRAGSERLRLQPTARSALR